jgi:hypothetical protein
MKVEINFKDDIKRLRPATWVYKAHESKERYIGYIAEELYEIESFKYAVHKDDNGNIDGIRYEILSVYALEALKSAYNMIEKLEKRIEELEGRDNE